MLIVIEGLDGSGKSTQVKNVHRFLEEKIGGKVHYLHFPRFDAPVVGEMIAKFLRGEFGSIEQVHPMIVALLFAQDRKDASTQIRAWLDKGETVLLDRYVYSNIAFQCAKLSQQSEQEELSKWIINTEYNEFAIPRPDLNIFLDVPLSFVDSKLKDSRSGDDRGYLNGKSDIHEADMKFQERVRQVYLRQCEKDSSFIRVCCSDPQGNMLPAEEIFKKLQTVINI